jgi:hypothetical protein
VKGKCKRENRSYVIKVIRKYKVKQLNREGGAISLSLARENQRPKDAPSLFIGHCHWSRIKLLLLLLLLSFYLLFLFLFTPIIYHLSCKLHTCKAKAKEGVK